MHLIHSPANRVATRDYGRIRRRKKTNPVGNVGAGPDAHFCKKDNFLRVLENTDFSLILWFLKALFHKGFTEQVFRKLLSQHKKHQKEQLLKDPAARSHNSGQVLLQASRKPRLVTCAEAQRGTQKRVGASSNWLRTSVQILWAYPSGAEGFFGVPKYFPSRYSTHETIFTQ
jgi:hypothetical protein